MTAKALGRDGPVIKLRVSQSLLDKIDEYAAGDIKRTEAIRSLIVDALRRRESVEAAE